MDPILKNLIDTCQLVEGREDGDYYFHRGKCVVKQPGALKIQRKYGLFHEDPHLSTCAGRAVVSGWWQGRSSDGEQLNRHWTTGEANPQGKAVEGSHPVAMAEKRWRVRGILACVLDPQLQSVVYGEEEFEPGWGREPEPSRGAASPERPPGAPSPPSSSGLPDTAPDWVKGLVSDWGNLCGEICEITGQERSAFERTLFRHLAGFKNDKGEWVMPRSKTYLELAAEKSGWALRMKKDDSNGWDVVLGRLRAGEEVLLRTFTWERSSNHWRETEPYALTPKVAPSRGGGSYPGVDQNPGSPVPSEYDPDDVPF